MSLPDPWAISGAVSYDVHDRTVTVVPAEAGYGAMLFRRGYERLASADRRGKVTDAVWGRGPGGSEVVGQPEAGALKFRFPGGKSGFSGLVGTAALSATITLDRRNGSILAVRFRGRGG